jgi:hypothetical protein
VIPFSSEILTQITTKEQIYHITTGKFTSTKTLVVCSTYGDTIYFYNIRGKLKKKMSFEGWSSNISDLCIKDIDADNSEDLITGGLDGYVRIISSTGNIIWQNKLPDAVVSLDSHDIDGDGAGEIVVGLNNKQLLLLEDSGKVLWSKFLSDKISLIKIQQKKAYTSIHVLLVNGSWYSFDLQGDIIEEYILGTSLVKCTFLTFGDKIFVVNIEEGDIVYYDDMGNAIHRSPLEFQSKYLLGVPSANHPNISYLLMSTVDNQLLVFKYVLHEEEKPVYKKKQISHINFKNLIAEILEYKTKMTLVELDQEIQQRLNSKPSFSLKEIIYEMISNNELNGLIDGNTIIIENR